MFQPTIRKDRFFRVHLSAYKKVIYTENKKAFTIQNIGTSLEMGIIQDRYREKVFPSLKNIPGGVLSPLPY